MSSLNDELSDGNLKSHDKSIKVIKYVSKLSGEQDQPNKIPITKRRSTRKIKDIKSMRAVFGKMRSCKSECRERLLTIKEDINAEE